MPTLSHNTITTRCAAVTDLEAVVTIEKMVYTMQWDIEDYKNVLESLGDYFLVMYDGDRLIGYGVLALSQDWTFTIATLAVHPEYQGQGYGRRLLRELIGEAYRVDAGEVYLHVRMSNTSAQCLYASEGFRELSTLANFYTDNDEDAYLMMKVL